MWKFKNKRKSSGEVTEPTTTIIEEQIAETNDDDDYADADADADDDDEGEGEGEEKNNDTSSTNDTIEKVDALLAQELNALSFQQRESINEEIHGINVSQIYFDKVKEIEETPELLNSKLRKLQIELKKLQPKSFAYDRCQQLYGDDTTNTTTATTDENVVGNKDGRKRSYINTDEFRIMFLRCELFDATKAARRFVNYVELMYELYGDIGIQRRIQLDDLSEDERKILELGYTQLLPGRDRAGRKIMVHIAFNSTNKYTAESRLRISFYVQMSVLNDIETQRKGALSIVWFQNVNIFDDFKQRSKTFHSSNSSPFRIGAVHICIPEELGDNNNYTKMPTNSSSSSQSAIPANIIKSMVALSFGPKMRLKLRVHTGSPLECLYALQSFGIPSSQFPLVVGSTSNKKRRRNETKKNDDVSKDNNNNDSNIKLDNHIKWLKLCQLKESNMKSYGKSWRFYNENYLGNNGRQQVIECPNHSDILSGRGYTIYRSPGNAVFRSVVASKLDEYIHLKSHPQKETTKLTLDIVHLLQNKYGARFLKEETTESDGTLGCWIEVSDEEARLKVRIAFRDKIKKQKQQQQQQQQNQMLQPSVFVGESSSLSNNKNKVATATTTNNCNAATVEKDVDSRRVFSFDDNNGTNDDHSSRASSFNDKQETDVDDDDKISTCITAHTRSTRSARVHLPLHNHVDKCDGNNNKDFINDNHGDEDDDNVNNNTMMTIPEEKATDSSTSMFLSMTGVGIGSGCKFCIDGGSGSGDDSCSSSSNSTGKKRELPTKPCFTCFDRQLRNGYYDK